MGMSTDYRDVKDYEDMEEGFDYLYGLYLQIIGVPEITDVNWKEVYTRIHLYEMTNGSMRKDKKMVSPEDIHSLIGFRTNANTLTRATFKNKIIDILKESADKELQKWSETGYV